MKWVKPFTVSSLSYLINGMISNSVAWWHHLKLHCSVPIFHPLPHHLSLSSCRYILAINMLNWLYYLPLINSLCYNQVTMSDYVWLYDVWLNMVLMMYDCVWLNDVWWINVLMMYDYNVWLCCTEAAARHCSELTDKDHQYERLSDKLKIRELEISKMKDADFQRGALLTTAVQNYVSRSPYSD